MARSRRSKASSTQADELTLYAENTYSLYGQKEAIQKNLAKKMVKGKYKPTLGQKGWRHWFDRAAKQYCKEISCERPWNVEFTAGTRDLAAGKMARQFRQECKASEYDYCKGVKGLRGRRRRR